jgi:nucleotide-binding universal stress UspA family protein
MAYADHRAVAGAGLLVTHLEEGCRPSEWLFGSRIEQFVRRFSIPVLLVKQPASKRYGQVLVGVKLDAPAGELIAAAKMLAPRAQINAVHVLGTSHEYRLRLAGVSEDAIRAHRTGAYRDAYRKLCDLVMSGRGHEAAAAPQVVAGNAPHRLLEMGVAARTGLIVLGKRPRHWLADLFLDRGIARTVLAEARSDVLLVPSK